ncbi:unnamed protein product [Dovyalis caffra]|uniref:Uncharacterized protein n=1 Tax=Dovyalis caffra TaxID=77055 RepID=A0AAV1RPM8_9ROSI|nr:unnamed protein product [Dovyalis caffra]
MEEKVMLLIAAWHFQRGAQSDFLETMRYDNNIIRQVLQLYCSKACENRLWRQILLERRPKELFQIGKEA